MWLVLTLAVLLTLFQTYLAASWWTHWSMTQNDKQLRPYQRFNIRMSQCVSQVCSADAKWPKVQRILIYIILLGEKFEKWIFAETSGSHFIVSMETQMSCTCIYNTGRDPDSVKPCCGLSWHLALTPLGPGKLCNRSCPLLFRPVPPRSTSRPLLSCKFFWLLFTLFRLPGNPADAASRII